MKTQAIERYLREHYSDEKLAALLAHAEDGKLAYRSCCCLVGVATADHPLMGKIKESEWGLNSSLAHLGAARRLEGAHDAEEEFAMLYNINLDKPDDVQRREFIIPIIRAEIARRDKLREVPTVNSDEPVSVAA